ncbi:acyloxyacyl hydrolase [Psychroserpens ponticola]|uniref:Acyloxyacyl hydrolase n=1 Tax=Psychroserpens ponticola TaxID=2932268 RepID=A0ABY7S1V7_9FLAO|nr:acyloxyacyl hydrolase [Psychroserpens ponticola]WCO03371.1 acyloxyacyl hydrolase [Psychroserpens ponticola]
MNKTSTLIFLFFTIIIYGQEPNATSEPSNAFILTPEVLIGITGESNTDFPYRTLQTQYLINFGWNHLNTTQEWAKRLKYPRTGLSIGYTDFGNKRFLGHAFSLLPFMEFNGFKKERFKVHVGTGLSYFNKKYDFTDNFFNRATSTDLTWSFRLFAYYNLFPSETIDWRIGAGYAHHSNGHTRLPNQGYNSFLVSFSADIKSASKIKNINNLEPIALKKSISDYYLIHLGAGINSLSETFSDKTEVYTISGEYGKIINNTFKLGVGFYYRFYQNYYDYINNNESLVQEGREYDYLKKNPFWNATNFGLTVNGEILLNHIGIDVQFGFNIHKPAYRVDWTLNQGYGVVPTTINEDHGGEFALGELDAYYQLKRLVSARFGLKYYFIGSEKKSNYDFYVGTFINSNFGQADFTEMSFGYIHKFNFEER